MNPAEMLEAAVEPREWITLADRVARLGTNAGHKLPSKFATLNDATRGGPRTGKVAIVGGAPGAGKTTWVTQLGVDYAVKGTHVAILACDEDADGLLVRIGQHFRLDRDAIEDGRAHDDLTKLAKSSLGKLLLIDADEDHASVEEASQELARRANGAPSVLIVDSLQTAQAAGTEEADGPRARVDAVMTALKRAAKIDQHLVIATCELSRGSYRSKKVSEQIDDLAAFKESGGIEYGASLALVLRSVRGGGDLVDVAMPKNRLGQRLAWRMEFDRGRASFAEVATPPAAVEDVDPVTEAKQRVRRVLAAASAPILSKGELKRRATGRGEIVGKAIEEMLDEGDMLHDKAAGYTLASEEST